MNGQQSLWPLRLLSVAIAVTLWLLLSYTGREQSRLTLDNVGVTYNIPAGLVVLNPASAVSVRLSGAEDTIRDLSPFQVRVSIEVTEPGLREVVLLKTMVSLPPRIDVLSFTPARLSVEVDEEIEKELRVVVDPGGSEPSGAAHWLQEETRTEPQTLRVKGPSSLLESRDTITATINLQNHLTSFVDDVPVDEIHELVQPVGTGIVRVFVMMEAPELPSEGETGSG